MGELATIGACCAALPATVFRMARPRQADRRFLSSLTDSGLPRATASVTVTPMIQARQHAPMPIVATGVFRPRTALMGMTTFLVEHSRARLLVDPALCANVHERVLPEMSRTFRSLVAPEKPVLGLAESLQSLRMSPADVDLAIATHLHWDHVCGLLELPLTLPLTTLAAERDWATTDRPPDGTVTAPFVGRSFATVELDGPPVLTFERSHDLFGDGSVVLLDLAGHTPGSIGVLLALAEGRWVLLAGDAVWNNEQVRRVREKAPLPGWLVDADRLETWRTIHRLHALPPSVTIVPSHDRAAVEALLS